MCWPLNFTCLNYVFRFLSPDDDIKAESTIACFILLLCIITVGVNSPTIYHYLFTHLSFWSSVLWYDMLSTLYLKLTYPFPGFVATCSSSWAKESVFPTHCRVDDMKAQWCTWWLGQRWRPSWILSITRSFNQHFIYSMVSYWICNMNA